MPIQSLNWNDKIKSLADGDNLSRPQKKSLMDQYNSNIPSIQNQLGYLPSYGPTTNPSRSAVQVINSAYDTSGNGGRKLVRLNDGTLVSAVKTTNPNFNLYRSLNNGTTWSPTFGSSTVTINDGAIATDGNRVFVLYAFSNATVAFYSTNPNGSTISNTTIDSSQTALGNCSLTYSPTDNTLHAAWASKNATYPNSFNIRYAKGTINGDGSVTWGSVEQRTTENTTGNDYKNPTISIKNGSGYPIIVYDFNVGTSNNVIQSRRFDGSSWLTTNIAVVNGYTQSSPSATVDGNGHIHVVWHGLDATDTTQNNIRYSKSTDGGVTWSAMLKLTTGNVNPQQFPSITYDQNNNLYVCWQGANGGFWRIRSIIFNGTWGSITDITNNTTADNYIPSVCDNVRTFTSPLVIWRDNVSPSVKFSGTWTDTPLLSETTSISAVSNKALIDAVVASSYIVSGGIKKKFASGSATSDGSANFTVTGLAFTPKLVFIGGQSYNAGLFKSGYSVQSSKTWNSGNATTGNIAFNASGFSATSVGAGGVVFDWYAVE